MSIQRASSVTPSLSTWKYDVFLSFRGEDTRKNFIDHLYAALRKGGINVFKDDCKLEKGKSIPQELYKAIEESRISIIVFSRNYASSTWCLDELGQIVQCMKIMKQMVIPVFYDVDPSVIRKQTENFQEVFSKHEEAFRENTEKVRRWRVALTEVANLSGWDLKDRHESEFIQDIVKEISRKISHTILGTFEDIVGIDLRLKQLRMLIGTRSDDVHMIGIYGMGGIGKTTIARAFYNLISSEFECRSFLANVREISEKNCLVDLQKQLLSQLLEEMDIKIWNVYDGISLIKSKLHYKKVLIVIDDVDDINQLNKLAGKQNWFGSGSMIIITTRDKHLLMTHGVDKIYEVEKLNDNEALQLLSLKAFKNSQPSEGYVKLSKCILKYADNLPLALEVLGSFLFGRTINEWESAIQRLGRDYEKGVLDSLQISFDGLKETEKKIFLDVACFFKGKDKNHVTRILDGCGFNPTIGIGVLIDKCLITISNANVLWMHDLLEEMGQRIVKRESLEQPGECSRLWKEADIHDVLTRNKGTKVVEGIMLEKEIEYFSVSAKVFSTMTNLRLLKICNVQLPEGLEYISKNLRLFEWDRYPLKSFPSSLQLDKTVELKMHYSRIEQLWKETKPLNNLKIISLIHSKNLCKTPDFTEVPNLEELILEGCTKLSEIHQSLLVHKKLILLNLRDCTSLTILPRKMDMESLKTLILSGCFKLKTFPKIVQNMEHLLELLLDKTPIKELPFPLEILKGIVLLSLEDCKKLVSLPSNINILKYLTTLKLSGCSKLENVPVNLGQVECLEKLDLSGTAIRQPVSSIFGMKNLKELSFRGCKGPPSNTLYIHFPFSLMPRRSLDPMGLVLPSLSGLFSLMKLDLSDCNLGEGAICSEISSLVSLMELRLEKNNFVSLPACINRLTRLEYLYLDNCKRLQSLPELPLNLSVLMVNDCTSLEKLPSLIRSGHRQICVSSMNCLKLFKYNGVAKIFPEELILNPTAELSSIIMPGSEVPKWFPHQKEGSWIRIKRHPNLKFKGFFVCVVVFGHKHLPTCYSLCHFECYAEEERAIYSFNDSPCHHLLSGHFWLMHIPVRKIHNGPQKNWYQFEFRTCRCSFAIVKTCAALPIYEEHVDEFDHPTEKSSSSISENLIEFHQDFGETSEMDVATTKPSLTDNDGAKNSGIAEEPQTKRQKISESS